VALPHAICSHLATNRLCHRPHLPSHRHRQPKHLACCHLSILHLSTVTSLTHTLLPTCSAFYSSRTLVDCHTRGSPPPTVLCSTPPTPRTFPRNPCSTLTRNALHSPPRDTTSNPCLRLRAPLSLDRTLTHTAPVTFSAKRHLPKLPSSLIHQRQWSLTRKLKFLAPGCTRNVLAQGARQGKRRI
jgi:hypothetical protein